MRSGKEIQDALRGFVTEWRDYTGSEKGEAQSFLNDLVACYGTDRKDAGATFGTTTRSAKPPPHCLWT